MILANTVRAQHQFILLHLYQYYNITNATCNCTLCTYYVSHKDLISLGYLIKHDFFYRFRLYFLRRFPVLSVEQGLEEISVSEQEDEILI